MIRACIGLMLAVLTAPAWGGAFARDESSEPAGEKVWALTEYLQGTAEQIRDKLNAEPRHFLAKRNEVQRSVQARQAEIDRAKADVLRQVRQTAGYRQAVEAVKAAQADLDTARRGGDATERLEASARYNKAREAVTKLEADAIAADRSLAEALRFQAEDEKRLAVATASLNKTLKWRRDLIEATRFSAQLHAPVEVDKQGVLGTVTPQRIVSRDSMYVMYGAADLKTATTKPAADGLVRVDYDIQWVRMLVKGIDTTGMREGHPARLDYQFRIDTVERGRGDSEVFVAVRKPGAIDHLLELMRQPLEED